MPEMLRKYFSYLMKQLKDVRERMNPYILNSAAFQSTTGTQLYHASHPTMLPAFRIPTNPSLSYSGLP
jgi:hypothetical protein